VEVHSHDLMLKAEVYRTVGCAMQVLNTRGHGLLEKSYENALIAELKLQAVPVRQQPSFQADCKHVVVGEYIPDLTVFDEGIVETKTSEKISDNERGHVINYDAEDKNRSLGFSPGN